MEKYRNLSVAVKHRRLGRMGGTLEINAFFPTKIVGNDWDSDRRTLFGL